MRIKNEKLRIYEVDEKYLKYLGRYDKNVRTKSNRKYYGILITNNNIDYCIPFTSKVKKRNLKLTVNIKEKDNVIAQLTINNMIPVNSSVVKEINIRNEKDKYYLYRELYFLRKVKVQEEILKKAENALRVLKDKNNKDFTFFKSICCNYFILEFKCKKWED